MDVRPAAGKSGSTSFAFVNVATGALLIAPNVSNSNTGSTRYVSATLSFAEFLDGGGVIGSSNMFVCELAPNAPLPPSAVVGCALTNRYAISSSICGAARHALASPSYPYSSVYAFPYEVTVPETEVYCQSLQNQVQTSAGMASAIAPARSAFYFLNVETETSQLARVVSASFNSDVPLNATCQHTFASLFRGLVPPRNTRVTIACPQCMYILWTRSCVCNPCREC
jgi:hypothetical protein